MRLDLGFDRFCLNAYHVFQYLLCQTFHSYAWILLDQVLVNLSTNQNIIREAESIMSNYCVINSLISVYIGLAITLTLTLM